MRHVWQLPPQTSLLSQAPDWRDPGVLLEYDGPQLVTLRSGGRDYLALAVDEDDRATRWIAAPLSHLEMEGLIRGGTSVRAVLAKEPVIVVDFAHEDQHKVAVWEVQLASLPDSALPDPGALLPTRVREQLIAETIAAQPSFDLGGEEHVP